MTPIAAPQLASELTSLASNTSAAPVLLQLGQVLSGTVIALLNNAMLRLQTPAGLLDVAADTPLPAGTPVAITVQGSAQQPRIVITPVTAGSRQPLPSQANEAGPVQIADDNGETNSAAAPTPGAGAANEAVTANPQGTATSAASSATQSVAANAAPRLTPTSTQPGTPQLVSPQAAITQAALSTATAIVRDAATSQGSLAALYADLDAAANAPSTPLPQPVLDAAKLVLAMRLNMASSQNVSAGDVSAALTHAGVASAVPAPEATTPNTTALDLGTALIALRQALKTWVDQQAGTGSVSEAPNGSAPQTSARINMPAQPYRGAVNVPQAPTLTLLATIAPAREQMNRVPLQPNPDVKTATEPPNAATPQIANRGIATNTPMPPYRGAPDAPQAPAAASLSSTAPPREQAIHLLSQTDAAVARQTLLRIVSLPGEPAGGGNTQQHGNDNATRVMFEIPIVTAQGTGVASMTIARDRDDTSATEGLRSWLVQFSIDLPEIGPVHARVALTGERAAVTLNAERADSAELLAAGLPLLSAGLRGAALEPGELRCRAGGANAAGAARPQLSVPGMFVDQAS